MLVKMPMLPEIAKDIKIFHGLHQHQLAELEPYLEKVSYPRGTWIVSEGENADGMYIICRGSVQVWKSAQGKKRGVCLGELGSGDCFGEMSLIDCQTRSANVVTTSDMEAFRLPYQAMAEIYENNPEFYGLFLLNIAREVSRRLRDTDRTVVEFALPRFG